MEFIADNYIWIIIVGIIILMTIIGYIADKTDFGKKKPEKKNKKQEENNLDEITVEYSQDELDPVDSFPADFEEKTEPAFDTDEMDLSPQIEEFKEETADEEIPEELFAGIDGTPNVYKQEESGLTEENEEKQEIIETNLENNENIENLEIELPSIDSLNQELADETEDDDVWKF